MFVGGRRGGGSFGGGSSHSSRNGSRDLIQNVAINDGLKKFNDFAEKITSLDEYDIIRQLYEECMSKWGIDDGELICSYYKRKMDILCSINKNTEDAEKKTEPGSNTLIRDGAIVDGLETFNDFDKKKMRPDECNIIRQQHEECVSKCGDDASDGKELASCGSKKTNKSADVSPSIFECLCLIP